MDSTKSHSEKSGLDGLLMYFCLQAAVPARLWRNEGPQSRHKEFHTKAKALLAKLSYIKANKVRFSRPKMLPKFFFTKPHDMGVYGLA